MLQQRDRVHLEIQSYCSILRSLLLRLDSRNRYLDRLANAGASAECYFYSIEWVYIVRKLPRIVG